MGYMEYGFPRLRLLANHLARAGFDLTTSLIKGLSAKLYSKDYFENTRKAKVVWKMFVSVM